VRILDDQENDIFTERRAELITYIKKSVDRTFYILSLIPAVGKTRILELGASPYLITAGIVDLLGLPVTIASDPDILWPGKETSLVLRRRTIALNERRYSLEEHLFNVEKDLFPFGDEIFDLVLCNELIEHLLFNPTHMLCEANRVLVPGGKLILSTQPNMLYWRLAVQLLLNITIEMPYSGNGPYGRHNRLFTPDELAVLARENGFEVEMIRVQTFREIRSKPRLIHCLREVTRLIDGIEAYFPIAAIRKKAGENITLLCRKKSSGQPGFPDAIYGSMYPDWLKKKGVHYLPQKVIINKWENNNAYSGG